MDILVGVHGSFECLRTPVFLQRNLASSLPMVSIGCRSFGIFLTIATSTCLPVLFGSPLQQKEFMPLHCIPFFRRILITLILSTTVPHPSNSTKEKLL